MKKRLLRKRIQTGGVYLGFLTLRGRKFPHGNFRTSVFCAVRTQIVGETLVSRQSQARRRRAFSVLLPYNTCDMRMAQSMMGILNAMKVGMQVSRI